MFRDPLGLCKGGGDEGISKTFREIYNEGLRVYEELFPIYQKYYGQYDMLYIPSLHSAVNFGEFTRPIHKGPTWQTAMDDFMNPGYTKRPPGIIGKAMDLLGLSIPSLLKDLGVPQEYWPRDYPNATSVREYWESKQKIDMTMKEPFPGPTVIFTVHPGKNYMYGIGVAIPF